ncbi:hypothetical protein ABVK25_009396 [Lepraria finkii]|uniref:Rhodopsin domain-containing protein n=1 Tax=Lepraria finkii TaxID=1340010 RepID=A0ABR4B3C0_9LECA
MLVVGSLMVSIGGGGRHQKSLTYSEIVIFLKTFECTLITYSLTIAMAKISILLLYRRIFATPAIRKATIIIGVACVMWAIAAICCIFFQCRPISGAWNPNHLFTDRCIDLRTYFQCISGAHMVLDIIILCMPLRVIYKLELPADQKLMVTGIFMIGSLGCIASLMRILTTHIFQEADLTYSIITPYLWSQLEPTMAVICACLITYRPLIAALDLRFLSSMAPSRKSFSRISDQSSQAKTPRDSQGIRLTWELQQVTEICLDSTAKQQAEVSISTPSPRSPLYRAFHGHNGRSTSTVDG